MHTSSLKLFLLYKNITTSYLRQYYYKLGRQQVILDKSAMNYDAY